MQQQEMKQDGDETNNNKSVPLTHTNSHINNTSQANTHSSVVFGWAFSSLAKSDEMGRLLAI